MFQQPCVGYAEGARWNAEPFRIRLLTLGWDRRPG